MSNFFYVRHASSMMFWELLRASKYTYAENKCAFLVLASWRNSRNDWFKKVPYDD
jgi:hypothetical protein